MESRNIKILLILLIVIPILSLSYFFFKPNTTTQTPESNSQVISQVSISPTPSVVISPPPTQPTPAMTLAEKNALYGPCINIPVLMYHHIQESQIAKAGGYQALSVFPEYFHRQLQYLHDQHYAAIGPEQLDQFFDNGIKPPAKSVLLTFDDAYEDFYTTAAPILEEFGLKATIFTPTGLVENPGYLKWNMIQELEQNNLFYFANHTWSHHGMNSDKNLVDHEISTAETQLRDHHLDSDHVFAYPYGTVSHTAVDFLNKNHYTLGFTTVHGSILCKKERLTLPRIRIGNGSLKSYGL